MPFNRAVPEVLAALGISYTIIRGPDDEELIDRVVCGAYESMHPHVGLILPSFWEGEEVCLPERVFPARARESVLEYRREFFDPVMTRYDAIRVIADALADEAVIANIGVPSKEFLCGERSGSELLHARELHPGDPDRARSFARDRPGCRRPRR
ncbi:MAG: hypothetical protein RQM90_09820 [Methanoculleus sp.]